MKFKLNSALKTFNFILKIRSKIGLLIKLRGQNWTIFFKNALSYPQFNWKFQKTSHFQDNQNLRGKKICIISFQKTTLGAHKLNYKCRELNKIK